MMYASDRARARRLLYDETIPSSSASVDNESSRSRPDKAQRSVRAALLTASVIVVAAYISTSCAFATIIGGVAVFLGRRAMSARNQRLRSLEFERDYPPFLLSLSSAIRTGLDPIVALCQSSALFDSSSAINQELISFTRAIEAGQREEIAVQGFARTINQPDIDLFRRAFALARSQGASLSETLQRLARVTRQRQSFRRRVNAALAMQKLSALGIAFASVVILVIQWSANSAATAHAFADPVGFKVICFGVGLIVAGLMWMARLSNVRL